MAKKEESEKLTGSMVRIRMRKADKALLEEAARVSGRKELSEWCRCVLVPAAHAALAGEQP